MRVTDSEQLWQARITDTDWILRPVHDQNLSKDSQQPAEAANQPLNHDCCPAHLQSPRLESESWA